MATQTKNKRLDTLSRECRAAILSDSKEPTFLESAEIRSCILQCIQQQSMTTTQIAACNIAHDAQARLARWLLMVADRTGDLHFQLTQELLAQMLGSRRSTVAMAAGSLQQSGFIEQTRGNIDILSRKRLETAACDCYGVINRLFTELCGKPSDQNS